MRKNNKLLKATVIAKKLAEAKFNPKADGAMKGISEMGEPPYYECRIVELLEEAKMNRNDPEIYGRKMKQVAQLAVLSDIWNRSNQES